MALISYAMNKRTIPTPLKFAEIDDRVSETKLRRVELQGTKSETLFPKIYLANVWSCTLDLFLLLRRTAIYGRLQPILDSATSCHFNPIVLLEVFTAQRHGTLLERRKGTSIIGSEGVHLDKCSWGLWIGVPCVRLKMKRSDFQTEEVVFVLWTPRIRLDRPDVPYTVHQQNWSY